MWMVSLLAYALPSTLIMYVLGSLVTYKIRLTKTTKIAGLFIAWILTAVTALLMADETTVLAAEQKIFPAAAIGSIIAIVGIALAGRRK
jgi:xanthine/uracil permease